MNAHTTDLEFWKAHLQKHVPNVTTLKNNIYMFCFVLFVSSISPNPGASIIHSAGILSCHFNSTALEKFHECNRFCNKPHAQVIGYLYSLHWMMLKNPKFFTILSSINSKRQIFGGSLYESVKSLYPYSILHPNASIDIWGWK